jgi:creatinine amidohydrolase/Fe(II)-dependent formamide hydrolase-like protein
MKRFFLAALLSACCPLASAGSVLHYANLNTRDFQQLDPGRTAVIIPGGILEQHGPYLPAGTDGIFNQVLADELAAAVAAQPGWTAVVLPMLPLGAGAANEIGRK